ncbi:histone-lysine N-methyltransferase SETMAR-like [Ceratina calcarata]|uniref:Histone-lysine N-methyltransferase SETMAR-like n=1 Tax=Ceratina calcarata TaxID=156304 RepID=A0AAJ7WF40_9HYME|nr:histone-lysine N-methyltransferase SETMAR-like [Ceratina calcarata]
MKAIIESNHHITVREIAKQLNVSHTTIENHIRRLGLVKKIDIWVPHELKEIHLTQRINVCDTNFKRNAIDPFLKRIITGDEKWIVYNNVNRKRSWSKHDEPAQTISKAELHQKKIMLSIWWDYKGVVYFELLPNNRTINSDVYCQQRMKLEEAIKEKRPELANCKGIVFHHDNARPHTSLATRTKLLELGWEVMSHPPYSSDLAPSEYHLFRSLHNFLNGKNFSNNDDLKSHLVEFLLLRTRNSMSAG